MEAEPKGLASGELTGQAFRSPARIDRPTGLRLDGLPSTDEVPPTDRFHDLPGRASRPPDRTVAGRGGPGTPLRVSGMPGKRLRIHCPLTPAQLHAPPSPA